MECLDLLRPQSLQLEKLEDSFRKRTLQLFIIFQPSGRHELRHLLGDRLADSLDRAQPLFGNQSLNRLA